MLQPVLVRPSADGTGFELIAGERRWRAAVEAGLTQIPAIVKEVSDAQALEAALIENLHREDLNPIERAQAYRQYLEAFGGTVEGLAAKLGESRANVSNYLRLLDLDPKVQQLVLDNQLSMGHARALASIQDPHRQVALANLVARKGLSVRQTEALVEVAQRGRPAPAADDTDRQAFRRQLAAVEEKLAGALGLPVRVVTGRKKNSGKVIIPFSCLEEFDRIARKICGRSALD